MGNTQPIFILGVMPRSGTNFLSDLLCHHPDCAAPTPIAEDNLLYYSDALFEYVDLVGRSWRREWQVGDKKRELLAHSIGSGLIEFLCEDVGEERLVTKSTTVHNLPNFVLLFPDAHLLILIRDGRDTVESLGKSWNVPQEWAMRRWADGARLILEFLKENHGSHHKYLVIRYENLVCNFRDEVQRILTFLDLDVSRYDPDAAEQLPVRGSSTSRGRSGVGVDWMPREKTADFKPIGRWHRWSRQKQERFRWIAGTYLASFGYEPAMPLTSPALYAIRNTILDMWWLIGGIGRAIAGKAKRTMRTYRDASS